MEHNQRHIKNLKLPNKACPGRMEWQVSVRLSLLNIAYTPFGFEFFLLPSRVHARQHAWHSVGVYRVAAGKII